MSFFRRIMINNQMTADNSTMIAVARMYETLFSFVGTRIGYLPILTTSGFTARRPSR